MSVTLHPLTDIPSVRPGDDLARQLGDALENSGLGLADHDVVVVCQKIVSKAEGRVVRLADVEPSERAREFAREFGKDPAVVELALQESVEVLRMGDGHLITATGKGFIAANSGLDRSNQAADGEVTLLPKDSDSSAASLRDRLMERFGCEVGVLLTDTWGRPWRMGQIDFAIGAAGIEVLDDFDGRTDWSGRPLEHTLMAVADQLSAAAGLLMGKAAGVPAVLIRGYRYRAGTSDAGDLVRPRDADLFR